MIEDCLESRGCLSMFQVWGNALAIIIEDTLNDADEMPHQKTHCQLFNPVRLRLLLRNHELIHLCTCALRTCWKYMSVYGLKNQTRQTPFQKVFIYADPHLIRSSGTLRRVYWWLVPDCQHVMHFAFSTSKLMLVAYMILNLITCSFDRKMLNRKKDHITPSKNQGNPELGFCHLAK